MKRFLAALLAALTLFTLTGCGKTENPAEPVTPGQAEEPTTPTEPELTPEEIAEQERLAAEKAREERLQGLLNSMTLEEKVGQLFFVRCPETNAGGYFYLPFRRLSAVWPGLQGRRQLADMGAVHPENRELPGCGRYPPAYWKRRGGRHCHPGQPEP